MNTRDNMPHMAPHVCEKEFICGFIKEAISVSTIPMKGPILDPQEVLKGIGQINSLRIETEELDRQGENLTSEEDVQMEGAKESSEIC